MHHDLHPRSVAQSGPLSPPAAMLRYLRPSDPLRARLETAVAALERLAAEILDQLDALTPDADLEPQGDEEPTMGATAVADQRPWCEDVASTRYPMDDQPARAAADECEASAAVPTKAADEVCGAWQRAWSAYEAAKSAHEAASNKEAGTAPPSPDIPPELAVPSIHVEHAKRWLSLDDLFGDILLSARDHVALAPRLAAFLAEERMRWSQRTREHLAADLNSDATFAVLRDAEAALLRTPAPDTVAIAAKLAISARYLDEDYIGLEDPAYVAFHAEAHPAAAPWLVAYRDVQLLAGRPDPLAVHDFAPRAWIKGWEGAGGIVCAQRDELVIVMPLCGAGPPESLTEALASSPWTYRAVFLAAAERLQFGGDAFYDPFGRPRARRPRFRQAQRIAFGRDGSGEITPHVTLVELD